MTLWHLSLATMAGLPISITTASLRAGSLAVVDPFALSVPPAPLRHNGTPVLPTASSMAATS